MGVSLNECPLVGERLQGELFTLLLRLRINKIAITADIAQMYLQVAENQLDLQQLVLRDFYMVDCLIGAESKEEAEILVSQLANLLRCGGFELSKWQCSMLGCVHRFWKRKAVLHGLPSDHEAWIEIGVEKTNSAIVGETGMHRGQQMVEVLLAISLKTWSDGV